MYESYYGLTKTPFSKTIAPSQLFIHPGHDEVVARLTQVVRGKDIGLLTAEVGCGKSVALRALSESLDAPRHTIVYFNGLADLRGFYLQLISTLGGCPEYLRANLVRQAKELIAAQISERRKNLVIMVDEAHLLSTQLLEELRLLTNEAMDSTSQFALILSGQPMLRQKLNLTQLMALSQRVSIRCRLKGLALEETAGYIRHYLSLCGRSDPLFSDDAIALIHSSSAGIPRRINNLAVQSLTAGFLEQKGIIDESSAKRAVAEMEAN
ncbi:MAG: AAA family ATPase [Candidatus Aquicultor sp.]|nr:AAA family ATPase [Candidatus Aquicultor sp.]